MSDTLEDLVMRQPPTAERPLLGALVLVVEDSRHACEALRLMCQRSGARIRRAESLASAERHLRSYRPRVAVIDLGLPDGSGLDLIARLAQTSPRPCGILATSGDETLRQAALAAGADGFLEKPLASLTAFQDAVLALTPPADRPRKRARPGNDTVEPDPIALRDDLTLAVDLLRSDPDRAMIDYVSAFLKGLGKSAGDRRLGEIAVRLGERGVAPADIARAVAERAARLAPV